MGCKSDKEIFLVPGRGLSGNEMKKVDGTTEESRGDIPRDGDGLLICQESVGYAKTVKTDSFSHILWFLSVLLLTLGTDETEGLCTLNLVSEGVGRTYNIWKSCLN